MEKNSLRCYYNTAFSRDHFASSRHSAYNCTKTARLYSTKPTGVLDGMRAAGKMGPMNSGLSTRIILLGPREFRERSEGIFFRKLSVHNRDSATAARGTGGGYIIHPLRTRRQEGVCRRLSSGRYFYHGELWRFSPLSVSSSARCGLAHTHIDAFSAREWRARTHACGARTWIHVIVINGPANASQPSRIVPRMTTNDFEAA